METEDLFKSLQTKFNFKVPEEESNDLSEAMNNVTNGSIWYDGVGYYEMDIDFDSYFIKLDSDDNITDTKYFTPY